MTKVAPMTVTCPTCGTDFPVDPDRVPVEGVLAICSVCSRAFRVERPAGWVSLAAPPSFGQAAPEEIPEESPAESPGGEHPGDEDPYVVAAVEEAAVEEAVFEEAVAEEPVAEDVVVEDIVVEEEFVVEAEVAVEDELAVGEDFTLEADVSEPIAETEWGGAVEIENVEIEDVEVEDVEVEEEPAPEPAADEPAEDEPVEDEPGQDAWAPPVTRDSTVDAGAPPVEGSPALDADVATSGRARFGFRDPANRARRLARVLSSDMITYNPARYADARRNGSLREDFRDEIEKSWEEYVDQVGEEFATSTHHFTDALNEVLAQGEKLFEGPGFPY